MDMRLPIEIGREVTILRPCFYLRSKALPRVRRTWTRQPLVRSLVHTVRIFPLPRSRAIG